MRKLTVLILALSLITLGSNPTLALPANEVISLGVEKLPQEDLVTIRTSEPVHYTYFKLKSSEPSEPNRIVVDIWDAGQTRTPKVISVGSEVIEQIRTGLFEENRVRIVLDLKADSSFRAAKSGNNVLIYVDNPLRTAQVSREEKIKDEMTFPLSHQEMVRRYYAKGKEFYIAGKYDEAKKEFQKLLTIDPSHTWAKRYIEEIEEEEKALKREAKERLAEHIGQVEISREREFMRHYGAGKAYFDEREYLEAIEEFKKAEALMPRHKFTEDAQSYIARAQRNLARATKETKAARIQSLITEGQSYYAAKEYDKAKSTWEKILVLDPYSHQATALIERANVAVWQAEKDSVEARKRIEEKARILDVSRSQLSEPYEKRASEKPELDMLASSVAGKNKEAIRDILGKGASQKVSLDFKEADLRDVIRQLHEWTGVNIVLDESVLDAVDPTITIYLTEVSLIDALEYIMKSKGLAYRVEKDVIFITTPEKLEAEEKMETRIYHLRKGLGTHTVFSEEAMFTKRPTEEESVSRQEAVIQNEKTIEDILRGSVSWPERSRITLVERIGALIVTNTLSNLQIIEDILKEFDVAPVQIMIEARFVEVGETALKELGLEWNLSADWGIDQVSDKNKLKLNKGEVTQFPTLGSRKFIKETGLTQEYYYDASANEYKPYPVKTRSQDIVTDSLGGLDLTLSGILTTPQFEAVLHAIEQHDQTNLLSSPKVTTLNGQEANIKIVTEYIYPTAYETTAAEYNSAGVKVKDATSTPEKFQTRDAGILLKVIPRVGMDKKMINLTIIPEVSALAEWYDYGTSETPYKQPFFESRKCITSIVINNGDTVVLGGLMKETTGHIRDKVPLLGDIPVLGALFRRDYDRSEKRNLLIFVTAHIITPSGEQLSR